MDFGTFVGNEALKAQLSAVAASGKFSHSYLLCGPEGSGKHLVARQLAAAIQCTSAPVPCGHCSACRKVFGGIHPDVIYVRDEEHKLLTVKQIRQIRADVFIRPNEGRKKIYIFEQDMNEESQNALLKILEEPPSYAVFFILSAHPDQLLPTIHSRCCCLSLKPVSAAEGIPFLQSKHPDVSRDACQQALTRAGGYLGQAMQFLEGNFELPEVQTFASCYASHDQLGMLRLLLGLEKMKRERFVALMGQFRQTLCSAFEEKYLNTASTSSQAILRSRTGKEILSAADSLQKAAGWADNNISTGAIIGWLAIRLK